MKNTFEPIRIETSLGVMFQTVNCYLIPSEQLTLIDCGLDSEKNWIDFQKKINQLGFKVADIKQVIITHEHRDHIGLLPKIMANSDTIIRAPKAIKGWFTRPDEMLQKDVQFIKEYYPKLGFPKEVLEQVFQYFKIIGAPKKIKDFNRFEYFEKGDILKIGNSEWEILNTPGHCPTQHIFIQKEQKRVFGSDMLLPIAPMPIVLENPEKSGQPIRALKQLLESFERLRSFDFQTIYPGHGKIFSNANAMIDRQLSRMQIRKAECLEAVKSGLRTPYEINRKMYPYQQIPPDFSGLHMVLGYLDLLKEEGLIFEKDGDLFAIYN